MRVLLSLNLDIATKNEKKDWFVEQEELILKEGGRVAIGGQRRSRRSLPADLHLAERKTKRTSV